jgi:hypothetical protein
LSHHTCADAWRGRGARDRRVPLGLRYARLTGISTDEQRLVSGRGGRGGVACDRAIAQVHGMWLLDSGYTRDAITYFRQPPPAADVRVRALVLARCVCELAPWEALLAVRALGDRDDADGDEQRVIDWIKCNVLLQCG